MRRIRKVNYEAKCLQVQDILISNFIMFTGLTMFYTAHNINKRKITMFKLKNVD